MQIFLKGVEFSKTARMIAMRPLTIFISHSSELLTDNRPHGDGLVAYEFISRLAEREHCLHVATAQVDLKNPLHPNITLHPIATRLKSPLLQRVEYLLRCRFLLKRLMRTEHFDVIHQLNPVSIGLSLGVADLGLPIVLGSYAARWANDPHAITSRFRLLRAGLRKLRGVVCHIQQKQAAAILITTPSARNQLTHYEALQDRVHLLPYGTNTQRYSPAENWLDPAHLAEEQQHPTILYLASLARRKGIFETLEAFKTVGREMPNCKLLVVGNGDQAEQVKQIALNSPVAGQIEFRPAQPRSIAVELYRQSALLCSPSLGEPFGMAVLEAMACGRPVVVTDEGGYKHTVRPEGGVHVPVGDSEALAAALLRLLRDPEERLRMALFNRQWAEEQFSWEVVVPRLEEVYRKVLPAA